MELQDGEHLVWRGHPSARASLAWYLKWGFLALLPFIITTILKWQDIGTGFAYWQWVLISLILVGVVVVVDVLRRMAIHYVVTTRRIRIRRGLLSRHEQSTMVEKVQNINMSQSLLERVVGVGDIDLDTAGADANQADFVFRGIANPRAVVQILEKNRIGTAQHSL